MFLITLFWIYLALMFKKKNLICLFCCLPILLLAQSNEFRHNVINGNAYAELRAELYAQSKVGNLDSAFVLSAQMLQFAADHNDPIEQKIDAYLTVGRMLKANNARRLAYENLKRALALYEAEQFAPSLYQQGMYASLAQLSEINLENQGALYFYRKAYALACYNRDTLHISSMLNNMGIVHLRRGALDSARNYFLQADSVFTHAHLSFNELHLAINNNLASVALRQKNYQEALERFDYSQHLRFYRGWQLDSNIRIKRITSALMGKAEAYLLMGNEAEARNVVRQLPEDLTHLSNNLYKKLREQQLYIQMLVAARESSWLGYYQAQQKWSSFKDSVAEVQAQGLSTFTEEVLNLQLQHAEKTLLLKTNAFEARYARTRLIWLTAFMASMLVLVLIGFRLSILRNRSRRLEMEQALYKKELEYTALKKETLEMKVKHQDVDLGALSAELMLMRNLNQLTQKKLREIKGKSSTVQEKQLQELSKEITSKVNQNKSRSLIHQHLEKVNTAFYTRLEEVAPVKLSKGEKELAALVRLRLEDAEIAELRATSVNAIHVTRHRLKKKLELNKAQDLSQFLRAL